MCGQEGSSKPLLISKEKTSVIRSGGGKPIEGGRQEQGYLTEDRIVKRFRNAGAMSQGQNPNGGIASARTRAIAARRRILSVWGLL